MRRDPRCGAAPLAVVAARRRWHMSGVRSALLLALTFALAAGGCGGGSESGDAPLLVSAIGARAAPGDPSTIQLDPARRLLMDATAQGLVRFDAAGGIEPGLAASWIVIDEGRSYIFRLREAQWPDGSKVTTDDVVRSLRRAAAPGSRNALAPFLAVIDEIVAMTDTVIEVRLKRPRPDLLKLFAQPEMAVFRLDGMVGSGPYRVRADPGGGAALLTPAIDPARSPDAPPLGPGGAIRLRGERAALAIARYRNGHADAVLGGSYADWPVVGAANVEAAAIRIDPAVGLFGLAVVSREGFLAEAANRAAIAMTLDRAALTAAFRPGWDPVETILPAELDSATAPARPQWTALALPLRRDNARGRVESWQRTSGPVTLRIALPWAPGATLVWNHLARSLVAIGIRPVRVGPAESADLRLIDAVAPYDSGRWYLAVACRLCSKEPAALIAAAREAATLEERAILIARADAALTADYAYIPIAQPFRWSIVTSRANGWQGNTRAWHPLNHLRNESE
jgi:oligopeptide transport system substrate-binding protein